MKMRSRPFAPTCRDGALLYPESYLCVSPEFYRIKSAMYAASSILGMRFCHFGESTITRIFCFPGLVSATAARLQLHALRSDARHSLSPTRCAMIPLT